ncbi:MAG: heterodisulfide reductase-related iron-sulfur binding cluster [Promethearchaeota archaeon]
MNFDRDSAIKEIEKLVKERKSPLLENCVHCFACNEYCEKGANPFDLIVELQEENEINQPHKSLISMYELPGEFKAPNEKIKGPVMSICAFIDHPQFYKGKLFEGLTLIRGRFYFCNLLYLHTARESIPKKRAPQIINNLTEIAKVANAKGFGNEIILFHDECYTLLTTKARDYGIEVSFKPVHIFKYLVRYLKEHKSEITRLNMNIAYQRPCSSRFTPAKEHFLDEIFDLIGVERVKRKYDRINALCCGAPQITKGKLAKETQKRNLEDAISAGAEALIVTCPMCYDTLKIPVKKHNLKLYIITDLCRLALGETISEGKSAYIL